MIKRVAYVLCATRANGGATKAFMSMLHGVMAKGIEPTVILPDKNGIYETLRAEGIYTEALSFRPNTYPNRKTLKDKLLFLPRMAARQHLNHKAAHRIAHILRKRNVQLVHTNVSITNVGHMASRMVRIPHVYHFREYADKDFGFAYCPSWKGFHDNLNTPKDYFICITRGIQQHHGLNDNAHARVIYDGVMEKRIEPTDNKRDNVFLYAGRIEPTKGLSDLLEAYLVAYRTTGGNVPPLHVAGAFSDKVFTEKMKAYTHENGIDDKIVFLGDCDNIYERMSRCKALFVPSRFEGFGLCMAEAMFQSTLVVGRNTAGTKEQLENGVEVSGHQIGIGYDTIDQLADIIKTLSTDSSQTAFDDMRHRAFKVVNSLYTIERHAEQVYEFYQTIPSDDEA